jgi:hypothetical protein
LERFEEARRAIAIALTELVQEGWMGLEKALVVIDPVMHGNARMLFRLQEKEAALAKAPSRRG